MTPTCTTGANPLAWKETAPGTFTRPLDTMETFFKWLADQGMSLKREHWGVSLALRLSFPASLPASEAVPYIQRAWCTLSKQHPMLHARPDGNVVTVSPLDEEDCLKESFFTYTDNSVTVDSLFMSIKPAPFASCHWLPGQRDLILHASHWRLDGIGSLKLADRFLTALCAVIRAGVTAPLESYGLNITPFFTPSLDEISNAYPDEASTPPAVKKVADSLLQTVLKGAPSIGLPLTPGTEKAIPGSSSRVRVTLDEPTTAAVVAACKSRGIKVTSAMHAAIVQATVAYAQHPLAKHYCITTAIDLRRRLPAGRNGDGPELAAGMFFSPGLVFIQDPAGRSFDAIAREFDATYGADMSRLYDAGDGETMPQPEGMPPQNVPNLSSIGVMERYLKREYVVDVEQASNITVEDVWMGGEVITPALCNHVWTWRDQMTLATVFNTAYYEDAFVKQVIEDVKRNLLKGLQI